MRRRLDVELVRRSLARSREHAAELIGSGRISVDGQAAQKAATQVSTAAAVVLLQPTDADNWVGRGAGKLGGALTALAAAGTPVRVDGRYCLDAGASTGGFTQVLLERGAAHVLAVDVGYGQLAWRLRSDERVTLLERTNVRALTPALVDPPAGLIVADLSFISLRLVLPALVAVAAPDADLLLMVKPQFEVGRHAVGTGGVVSEPALRAEAVLGVVSAAGDEGLRLLAATASALPGPAGNVEYFVLFQRGEPVAVETAQFMVAAAIEQGPTGRPVPEPA